MNEEVCKNCRHFRQHYVKAGYRYQAIEYGHCVHPRLKRRMADSSACPHFRARAPREGENRQ